MAYEEAAASLRDDPSFATMTPAEREAEAAELLGDDDPLAIALAIELAMAAPAAPIMAAPPGAEPCRLETDCGGREPIAGNGRCMTCGAVRKAAEAPPRPAPAAPPVGEPMTLRVKQALGATDKEIAQMIGVSRPTAQAYACGRLPEIIDGIRAEYMLRAVRAHAATLTRLEADLSRLVAGTN